MNTRSTAVTLLPWLLWLMLVGLPRSGWAAGDVPLKGSLSLLAEQPRTETGPTRGKQPEHYRAPRGLRLLAEVGAGTVTALVGGVAGIKSALLVCLALRISQGEPGCGLGALLIGGVLGLSEGYAVGVWLGGEAVGGDGSLLTTLLGATSALVLASAAMLVIQAQPRHTFDPMVIIPLPVMLGAHLGYELFQRSPVASLQPSVALSSGGATLGLSGRF